MLSWWTRSRAYGYIIPTAIPSDTESHCTIAGHLARTYHYLWYQPYYTLLAIMMSMWDRVWGGPDKTTRTTTLLLLALGALRTADATTLIKMMMMMLMLDNNKLQSK